MKINIREALPSDARQILEHIKICGSETDNLSYGEEGLSITIEEEKRILQELLNCDNEIMLVAEINGMIVGTANYSTLKNGRMSHRGNIGLCVQRKFWNQGIATNFIDTLIVFAKDKAKSKIISLEVRSDNKTAIHLYKKFGFEKIGTFEGYFEIDGDLIDFDYMYLKI
ncbi:acetyltransferase, GNAT family [Peptoniphilus duerdenii ATCC BAA-1640]|uniref:Acetyltransferase, GNAT family n=1 Tax=Peptoniphilus duerdenii ATCC BAA-1640 TaxID=862517 RepID=E0NNP8_9FIRM|nr:GNAT family N-acetyltransferase [Peptoniphilus duerdenii]EFM24651.1 acetyltransferase, GNAT family [Peptoniphilus duerdenii ATCC BAA-1640]